MPTVAVRLPSIRPRPAFLALIVLAAAVGAYDVASARFAHAFLTVEVDGGPEALGKVAATLSGPGRLEGIEPARYDVDVRVVGQSVLELDVAAGGCFRLQACVKVLGRAELAIRKRLGSEGAVRAVRERQPGLRGLAKASMFASAYARVGGIL